jgi:putative YphP/YqiW family bacilliredoxin
MVQPMREELTSAGVKELKTASDVESALKASNETSVVLINSVCGCAAGTARPGFIKALENETQPKNIYTVFAGVDREATDTVRSLITNYAPSSPSVALFRDGEVVHLVERQQIEGSDPMTISKILSSVYNKYCGENIDENAEIFDPEGAMDINVQDVKAGLENKSFQVYDIRSPEEIAIAKIEGTIPLDQALAEKIVKETPKDEMMVFHCHHGMRSRQAVKYFAQFGFTNLKSMKGGIQAWSEEIDSSVPTY